MQHSDDDGCILYSIFSYTSAHKLDTNEGPEKTQKLGY